MKLSLLSLLLCFSAWAESDRIKYWDIMLKVKRSQIYECDTNDGKKLQAIINRTYDLGPSGVVRDWGFPVAVGNLVGDEFKDLPDTNTSDNGGIGISPSGQIVFAYSKSTANGSERFIIRCQLEQIEAYMDRREGKEINSPHSPQSRPASSTTR